MIDVAQYVSIISNIAIVLSVLVLAAQARELTRQSKLANKVAGITANNEQLHAVDDVLKLFLDHPELRSYFYENKPVPEDQIVRQQIEAMAELMADSLASVIQNASAFEWNAVNLPCWLDYSTFLINNSPALRAVLIAHPKWFPEILAATNIKLPTNDL